METCLTLIFLCVLKWLKIWKGRVRISWMPGSQLGNFSGWQLLTVFSLQTTPWGKGNTFLSFTALSSRPWHQRGPLTFLTFGESNFIGEKILSNANLKKWFDDEKVRKINSILLIWSLVGCGLVLAFLSSSQTYARRNHWYPRQWLSSETSVLCWKPRGWRSQQLWFIRPFGTDRVQIQSPSEGPSWTLHVVQKQWQRTAVRLFEFHMECFAFC